MIRLVVGRLVGAVGLLLLLSILVYVGVDLLPGDAASARLGITATPERLAQARARLGLDQPLPQRYLEWLGGLLRGDLGRSATGVPVAGMLEGRLANSVLLAGLAAVLLVPLSLAVGLWAGTRAGHRTDRVVTTVTLLLVAVPEFVTAGALVLVFAIGLGVLPAVSLVPPGASPLSVPEVLVLPVLSLVLLGSSYAVRVIRAAAAGAVQAPHVEAARLNGASGAGVMRGHLLPAVLPVAVQVWLVTATALVGGAVLVETVFGYPGIGALLVASVGSGDLPVVQALAMILGAAMLVALILADVAVRLLTPTLRTSRRPLEAMPR
ncbi:MAG: ABC transporter permease [Pseudonocardia sp. SCN 72-86]|nr:MAG: ABC transporter permease [Pseudonocardia sp. SCN 72-86]